MRALRLLIFANLSVLSLVETVPSYEGIATSGKPFPNNPEEFGVETVPSYEGIATKPYLSSLFPPKVETVPSYEGIATQLYFVNHRSTPVETVPSYEGIATKEIFS